MFPTFKVPHPYYKNWKIVPKFYLKLTTQRQIWFFIYWWSQFDWLRQHGSTKSEQLYSVAFSLLSIWVHNLSQHHRIIVKKVSGESFLSLLRKRAELFFSKSHHKKVTGNFFLIFLYFLLWTLFWEFYYIIETNYWVNCNFVRRLICNMIWLRISKKQSVFIKQQKNFFFVLKDLF